MICSATRPDHSGPLFLAIRRLLLTGPYLHIGLAYVAFAIHHIGPVENNASFDVGDMLYAGVSVSPNLLGIGE